VQLIQVTVTVPSKGHLIGAGFRSTCNWSELGRLMGATNQSNCNCFVLGRLEGTANMSNCNFSELGCLLVQLIGVIVTVSS